MKSYLNANIAARTRTAYRKKHKLYKQFCTKLRFKRYSQRSMCMFVTHLADFMKYSYILQHVSAIKHYRKRFRKEQKMRYLRQVMHGIKRSIGEMTTRPKRLPITPKKLRSIKQKIQNSTHSDHERKMLWCACLFAYYGFMRVSEYTSPKRWDHDPQSRVLLMKQVVYGKNNIHIHLKKSKTDPTQRGTDITIARNNTKLCPLRALKKYIKARGTEKGPIFQFENKSFLTPQLFNKFIKSVLPARSHGVYSSHSFRIGAASTAAAKNYPDYMIKQLGRWTSDCYMSYIKTNKKLISNVSRDLAEL